MKPVVAPVVVVALAALTSMAGCHAREMWQGLSAASQAETDAPAPSASATALAPDPVVEPLKAGVHPRILLTDERLRAVAEGAKRASPSWNSLIANCQSMSAGKNDSGYQGDQWGTGSLDLAMCWRIRKDPTFGKAAVAYLMALVDDHENVGDHLGGMPAVRENDGYPIRYRGFFAAVAYDWLYDLLTVEQRKHLADRFVDFCHWYIKDGYKTDDPIANHYMGYFGACAMGGLALDGDDPRGTELRAHARKMWRNEIVPAYARLPGGDFPEGWQYARIPALALGLYVDSKGGRAATPGHCSRSSRGSGRP